MPSKPRDTLRSFDWALNLDPGLEATKANRDKLPARLGRDVTPGSGVMALREVFKRRQPSRAPPPGRSVLAAVGIRCLPGVCLSLVRRGTVEDEGWLRLSADEDEGMDEPETMGDCFVIVDDHANHVCRGDETIVRQAVCLARR